MAALGRRYRAEAARELGIVNAVFEASTYESDAERWVRELASRPPGALGLAKRLLYELDGLGVDAGFELAAQVNAEARTSEECREGVRRFLEKSGDGGARGSAT
jgi:methylglutaconyl-CoA hydratase